MLQQATAPTPLTGAAPAGEPSRLGDLFASVRRRRKAMLISFAVVLATCLLAAVLWPATYRASGTILIEQQELPSDLVRSAISSFADQRIQVITQRVMTTENLFKIVEQYDLYPRLRQSAAREQVIKRMHDDISFDMISADVIDPRMGRPTKATIAFSVSYRNRSPVLAARVANELVSLYLRVNIESRLEDAADATQFMGGEVEGLDKQITRMQSKIAAFKQAHLHSLPDQVSLNTELMTRTEDTIRDNEAQTRADDQQLVYLNGQLGQVSPNSQVYTSTGERVLSPSDRLKYLRTEYAKDTAIYSPTHPDVIRLKREIAGLEKSAGSYSDAGDLARQLDDARTQLATARQKYSDSHPDVVRLQRQIDTLQASLDAARSSGAPSRDTSDPDNPAYIGIKTQREGALSERTALLQKHEQLEAALTQYQTWLAAAPQVEREYSEMMHDLDNAQLAYNQAKMKQVEAQQSEHLENERKGERFTLIEPPTTPEQPASPNRLAIVLVGFLLALGAAYATMATLETVDGTVRNRRDLERLLSVPPLAVLPWIETPRENSIRLKRRWAMVAAIPVAFAGALVLVNFFYRPLDVLWQVMRRKAGL